MCFCWVYRVFYSLFTLCLAFAFLYWHVLYLSSSDISYLHTCLWVLKTNTNISPIDEVWILRWDRPGFDPHAYCPACCCSLCYVTLGFFFVFASPTFLLPLPSSLFLPLFFLFLHLLFLFFFLLRLLTTLKRQAKVGSIAFTHYNHLHGRWWKLMSVEKNLCQSKAHFYLYHVKTEPSVSWGMIV